MKAGRGNAATQFLHIQRDHQRIDLVKRQFVAVGPLKETGDAAGVGFTDHADFLPTDLAECQQLLMAAWQQSVQLEQQAADSEQQAAELIVLPAAVPFVVSVWIITAC